MVDKAGETSSPYTPPTGDPTPSQYKNSPSFGTKSARLSWQLPIVGVILNQFLRFTLTSPEQQALPALLLLILSVIGFLAATVAMFSIIRCGWRNILMPASIGLILNGALLILIVSSILFLAPGSE